RVTEIFSLGPKSKAVAQGSSASDKRFTFGKGWRSNEQKVAIFCLCCFAGHADLRTAHSSTGADESRDKRNRSGSDWSRVFWCPSGSPKRWGTTTHHNNRCIGCISIR